MGIIMQATNYGSVTMVGYGGPYPRPRGNCFSLEVKGLKNGYTRIVNFGYENLKELFRNKLVSWPIEVEILDEKRGIIVDKRISQEWYSEHWCSVCCPIDLMPEYEQFYYKEFDRLTGAIHSNNSVTYPRGMHISDEQRSSLEEEYRERKNRCLKEISQEKG